MKILVDNREPQDIIDDAKECFGKIKVKQLLSGDLVCGDIAIERKTIFDFVNSVISGRVFDQADLMSKIFKRGYVIIIGTLKHFFKVSKAQGRETHFTDDNFLGAVESIMRKKNIKCFQVNTKKQFFTLAKKIFKKANKKKSPLDNIKRIKPKSEDVFVSQIACVDGIGVKKAYNISQVFKTPRQLCDASIEDLMTVQGIGKRFAVRVKEVYK